MSATFYVHGQIRPNQVCLKILNAAGEELSVAFDDSAGALKHLGRVSVARFKGDHTIEPDRPLWDAEDFLQELARHLGYQVTKTVVVQTTTR